MHPFNGSTPTVSNALNLIITGLPGSGKTRVIKSLLNGSNPPACFESQDLSDLQSVALPYQILCVIDVRSPLLKGVDDWLEIRLQQLLSSANGIVFSFLESAGLDDQAWWNRWVAQNAGHLPIVRWLNQSFPFDWQGFEIKSEESKVAGKDLPKSLIKKLAPLQTFEFSAGQICWEHLLFGLDSSKQNLGMKIARVKGIVQTVEYANKVAIEGSALRWELFAADQDDLLASELGMIQIQGEDLDQAWLDELVKASLG
jgi:G3E family GTPase